MMLGLTYPELDTEPISIFEMVPPAPPAELLTPEPMCTNYVGESNETLKY
jgi:hypothetical protein